MYYVKSLMIYFIFFKEVNEQIVILFMILNPRKPLHITTINLKSQKYSTDLQNYTIIDQKQNQLISYRV